MRGWINQKNIPEQQSDWGALYYISEFHADGFRYDQISDLISMNCDSGWAFCCNMTNTLRYAKSSLLQNAEFWPGEVGNYPKTSQSIVTPTSNGGAGFDVVQHDGLRTAVRMAVQAASYGRGACINLDAIAGNLGVRGSALFDFFNETDDRKERDDVGRIRAALVQRFLGS